MEKPVIIFGAKGIARAALEIFESNGVVVYGFLDQDVDLHQTEINNIPVLGYPDDQGYLDLIDKADLIYQQYRSVIAPPKISMKFLATPLRVYE